MTHDEAWELALRDLEAPIGATERRALDEHLATCGECRAQMASLRVVDAALRAAKTPSVPLPHVRPGWWHARWLQAAALLVLTGGGFLAGRQSATRGAAQPTSGEHRFVFLLEEPQSAWPPPGGAPLNRNGYVQWARDLGKERRLSNGGIQLTPDDGWYVDRNGEATPARDAPARQVNYSGFFVVSAKDYSEALRLARASPHLDWGGILVRQAWRP